MAVVDVLLPAYNAAGTIRSALLSLQRQSFEYFRVLMIDDGSTDGTAEIFRETVGDDPRFVLLSKENGGIVDALNYGLAHVTAPLVARMDGDDISTRDRFARQVRYLNDHPHAVAVGGAIGFIKEDNIRYGIWVVDPIDKANAYLTPAVEPFLPHPFLMVRTEALRAVGGYRYVFHAEDADLYWRLARLGWMENLREPVVGWYRVHPNSISGKSLREGRIQAFFGSLSGVSAQRIEHGMPDLIFEKEMLAEARKKESIAELLDLFPALTAEERDYVKAATVFKLIEFTGFRPYEAQPEDIRLALEMFSRHTFENDGNMYYIVYLLRRVAYFSLRRGRWSNLAEYVRRPELSARLALKRTRAKVKPKDQQRKWGPSERLHQSQYRRWRETLY
ncbi:glycosyltransferase family 2 protein [Propylenella binzhouense]|uniref:Glycosyltransferase family 2 protein n=1 Tax=Propylenella binzhouense TaxID=2555902 RepID=A0A964T4F8_9HYPH|nr:glycosyltransferase family 2 protein [Propylenella binzhouense]MYZ47747.1 glycosyltransferase family 2 protein [Propylenella binzhouense]